MLAATYRVTIERHEVGDIPALTFQCDDQGTSDCPLVFAVHGLTSRKERHLDLCLRLADAGFRACSFDARSHGERRDRDSAILAGNRSHPDFAVAFARTVIGTVQDIITLASYFNVTHYALVGHSMGGFIALQAALHDPRATVTVNIAGSIDPRPPATANISPEHRALAERADIATHAAELKPRAVLLLHGEEDDIVPVAGAHRLYNALKEAYREAEDRVGLRLYPAQGHDVSAQMAQDTIIYLRARRDEGLF